MRTRTESKYYSIDARPFFIATSTKFQRFFYHRAKLGMVDTPKKIACNPKSAIRRDPWKQLLVVRTRSSSIFQPSCPTTTLLISFPSNSLQWSALYPFSWLFCIELDTALQVRRSRRDCRSSRYATTVRIYPPSWRAPEPHSYWPRDRVVGRLYTALRRAPPSVPRELHLRCVLTLGFCFSAIFRVSYIALFSKSFMFWIVFPCIQWQKSI